MSCDPDACGQYDSETGCCLLTELECDEESGEEEGLGEMIYEGLREAWD